jgi:hypothetical protein
MPSFAVVAREASLPPDSGMNPAEWASDPFFIDILDP